MILSTYNIPVSEMVVCDQSMDCSICHNQAVARLTVSFTLSFTNSHSLLVGGASQLPVQLPRDQQATKLIFAGSRVNLTEQFV